jgi:hypothetical protein
MAAVSVRCPECGAGLKLPNAALLGKKGKCPRCQHRFVLQASAEAAKPRQQQPRPAAPQQPLTGTSARWIPDEPAPNPAADIPVFPLAETVPPPTQQAGAQPAAAVDGNFAGPVEPAVESGTTANTFDFAEVAAAEIPAVVAPASPVTRVRRRRKRSLLPAVLTGVGSALVVGTIIGFVLVNRGNQEPVAQRPPAPNAEWEQQKADLATSNAESASLSPTQGEPIPLNYIPFTPHLLLHLRPAELWQRDRDLAEFHATTGNLGVWLKDNIRAMTRYEAEEIEELTFAINFGPRNSEPDIAAVVRLKEQQTQNDLFNRLGRRIRPDLDATVYESGEQSFLLIDMQTFAVAPTSIADALVAAKDYPALAPADLEPLLKDSDRDRHVTLLFDVRNIDIHRESVFGEQLWPLTDQMVVWFGKQIDSISWSIHLQPNLFMETLLRQSNESSALKVQRHFRLQLDKLPEQLLELAQLMRPTTTGSQRMVGRFPAMMEAVSRATSVDVAGQYVRCVTLLPKKAAANLAAASLLTWNQSVVTDFSTAVALEPTATLPDTIAARMELPALAEFRNDPLQEAIASIGNDIKVEFVIDGDGLKAAGFTQNMPQKHSLGSVSAKAALHAILSQYAAERDPMVVCIDETNKRVTLTTRSKAKQAGMAEFDTAP